VGVGATLVSKAESLPALWTPASEVGLNPTAIPFPRAFYQPCQIVRDTRLRVVKSGSSGTSDVGGGEAPFSGPAPCDRADALDGPSRGDVGSNRIFLLGDLLIVASIAEINPRARGLTRQPLRSASTEALVHSVGSVSLMSHDDLGYICEPYPSNFFWGAKWP
jgi:hypothetical protein